MKDVFSKITFGFLMAQFVPGCVAVVAISMVFNFCDPSVTHFISLMSLSFDVWFDSGTKQLMFVFLSMGAGMAIHGLNWAMLAFLESYFGRDSGVPDDLLPLRDNPWHSRRIGVQLLFGPGWLVYEIYLFVTKARNLNEILVDENVGLIPKDKMAAFDFLQDFYLSFAQFYAHISYALVLFIFPSLIFTLMHQSFSDLEILICLYFMASYFFLIGRVQMSSLFKAETKLKAMEKPQKWRFKDSRNKD